MKKVKKSVTVLVYALIQILCFVLILCNTGGAWYRLNLIDKQMTNDFVGQWWITERFEYTTCSIHAELPESSILQQNVNFIL